MPRYRVEMEQDAKHYLIGWVEADDEAEAVDVAIAAAEDGSLEVETEETEGNGDWSVMITAEEQ